MNKMTVTKVRTGQENTNPAITTLVYREKSYPAREVQGKDGNYTVSVERLEQELLDGIKSLDPAAFELDESIVDPTDVEMLEDLIMAATNEALGKADEASTAAMSSMTGGLNLGGLPF